MKTVILIIISFLFEFGYCSEIHIIYAKVGESYNITCSIKELKDVKACFLLTPSDQVKMLWSGARLDKGRIMAIDDPTLCGAKVREARKDDAGVWRCIVEIHTSEGTINKIAKLKVIVQDPVPDRQIQQLVPAKVIESENLFFRSL